MGRVVHFEIHADDPPRAVAFYQKMLGWQFHKWDGQAEYYLITTGPDDQPGINGGLMKRQLAISNGAICAFVCTADVENLDETVARGLEAGGQVALPRMPVPGVGWMAYLKDTEGNIVGLMQNDPTAA